MAFRDLYEISEMFAELNGYEQYEETLAARAVQRNNLQRLQSWIEHQLKTDPTYPAKRLAQLRVYHRERYATDPEYRERILDSNRKSRAKHREDLLARRRTQHRERYAEDPAYRARHLAKGHESTRRLKQSGTYEEYRRRVNERRREARKRLRKAKHG